MSNNSSSSSPAPLCLACFVAGAAVSSFLILQIRYYTKDKKQKQQSSSSSLSREHAGATIEGDDLSLFYSNDVEKLKTVTEDAKFLPKSVYEQIVQNSVVCCVDILAVRTNGDGKKQCLLVERSSEPVKGVWWLPGGRLYKGETFFDAATRKAKEETGLSQIKPIQVLGIWNTFFPTSHWDTAHKKGTQTVNPIVLVELLGNDVQVQLDNTSENYKWISLNPIENYGQEDKYVINALQRLHAWNPEYSNK